MTYLRLVEFERNHGMDIVTQAKLEMSALVHAASNILLRLNNLGKQCETQCVLHTGLLLEEL